jgi:DNA-binding beta-propeller fold protein YncE
MLLFAGAFQAQGQVLMKEMLTQDQKGSVDKSVNWAGKNIYFTLKYDSSRDYKFETYSTKRYYYTLMLADNPGMNNAIKIPGMVRDLVITTYFEFYFNNGTESKTFTMIYDKNNKWYRIKFAPQAGCRRQELWQRVNDIKSYTELLSSMVGQMDANLKLDCYKGHEAPIAND